MRVIPFPSPRVWSWFLVALGLVWGMPARAMTPPALPAIKIVREQAPEPQDKGGIEFEMDDKRWTDVFEWLSDQTELPVITTFKPPGTFTFIGPKGARYTIPEIVAIINQALLRQDMILIRREESFALRAIDPSLVHRRPDPGQLVSTGSGCQVLACGPRTTPATATAEGAGCTFGVRDST